MIQHQIKSIFISDNNENPALVNSNCYDMISKVLAR